jgi:hypothetical protein
MEEIDLGKLDEARMATELTVISRRHQTVTQGKAFRFAPEWSHFELIDAIAPGVPLPETRLVLAVRQLQAIQASADYVAELVEFVPEAAQLCLGELATQPRPEQGIVAELVAQLRRSLNKRSGPVVSAAQASIPSR